MIQKQTRTELPIGPILNGSLTGIFLILIMTVFLGIITQFGWTGTVKWAGTLYLIVVYLAIVLGSILAGMKSGRQGWITGLGVGLLSSIFILILAAIAGENIGWPIFLLKSLVNSFVGVFGGIIGVNFANRE